MVLVFFFKSKHDFLTMRTILFLFIQEVVSLVPDIFRYNTCIDSPPDFSPGCMANLTVNLGEPATFNCQVDPRCHIQYLYWFHEVEGSRRLIKTGKNSSEPYMHTIRSVLEKDLGRYLCVIANIRGENECGATLSLKSRAAVPRLWTSVVMSRSSNRLQGLGFLSFLFFLFGKSFWS